MSDFDALELRSLLPPDTVPIGAPDPAVAGDGLGVGPADPFAYDVLRHSVGAAETPIGSAVPPGPVYTPPTPPKQQAGAAGHTESDRGMGPGPVCGPITRNPAAAGLGWLAPADPALAGQIAFMMGTVLGEDLADGAPYIVGGSGWHSLPRWRRPTAEEIEAHLITHPPGAGFIWVWNGFDGWYLREIAELRADKLAWDAYRAKVRFYRDRNWPTDEITIPVPPVRFPGMPWVGTPGSKDPGYVQLSDGTWVTREDYEDRQRRAAKRYGPTTTLPGSSTQVPAGPSSEPTVPADPREELPAGPGASAAPVAPSVGEQALNLAAGLMMAWFAAWTFSQRHPSLWYGSGMPRVPRPW